MTEPLATIKFGTDGWRALIAREFTFANVERVAQAYADFLITHKEEQLLKQLVDVGQVSKEEAVTDLFMNVIKGAVAETVPFVVVGFDRRFLSEHFAKRAAEMSKTLVYERRVAADVSAYQGSREMSGQFQIVCTAANGIALTELNTAILSAVVELAGSGPTDVELERGVAQTEAQFVYRLQTTGGKGDQLNAYNTYVGDPGFFDGDRRRYLAVTSKGAAAATQRWLVNAPAVTLSVVPKGRRDLALPGAVEVQVS